MNLERKRSNVVVDNPPASPSGSDCAGQSVQECQGLSKCATDTDNVPLALRLFNPIRVLNMNALWFQFADVMAGVMDK